MYALMLMFVLIPALEIYLLFSIGGLIGGLNTFLIIILTGVIGATMARTQGLSVLFKIQTELQQGKLPTNQLLQGLLVFGGGLLLLTPGFITDILGFSMVAPGSRNLISLFIKKYFSQAIASGNVHFHTFGANGAGASYHHHSSQGQKGGVRQVAPDTFEVD